MKLRKKNILMLSLFIGLTISTTANAQFGGLINKAKKTVDKTVKSTTKKAEKSTENVQKELDVTDKKDVESASSSSSSSSSSSVSSVLPGKKLKPSAEAIAADSLASCDSIPKGYTKSYAEIRAAYEQLDGCAYVKPYYINGIINRFYFKESLDPSAYMFANIDYDPIVKNSRKYHDQRDIFMNFDCFAYVELDIPFSINLDKGCTGEEKHRRPIDKDTEIGCFPVGFDFINGELALFAADPKSRYACSYFIMAKHLFSIFNEGIYYNHYGAASTWDGRHTRNKSKDGKEYVCLRDMTYIKGNILGEIDRLERVLYDETPFENVLNSAEWFYRLINKATEASKKRCFFHLFDYAMVYVRNHPKKVENDLYKKLDKAYAEFSESYYQWIKEQMEEAAPVDMPKTYSMSSTLAQKALAAAQKEFPQYNVSKVVFLGSSWKEFKEPKYPYRTMLRAIPVGLLSKKGDAWYIRQYSFRQASDLKGGWTENYSFTAPGGGLHEARKVNYK